MMSRRGLSGGIASWALIAALAPAWAGPQPARQVERLDRGVVAVPAAGGGVLIGWRSLRSDAKGAGFEVFRDGRRITPRPVTDSTNFRDTGGTPETATDGRARRSNYERRREPRQSALLECA